jgi:nucleoside-diphosphate-sugar epimerase
MSKKPNTLNGKLCLVTGGTGFIGSHLCARLHDRGARVVNLDIEPAHSGTMLSLLSKGRSITTIQADLAEPKSINLAADLRPDVIFHLAGRPYAPDTSAHPAQAHRSNVTTTVNMLDAARRARTHRFVLASSACVYGATQASPLKADTAYSEPEHYYTYTKREAEFVTHGTREYFNLDTRICRLDNVYGPGDRHLGRIIPRMCSQLISDKSDTLHLSRSSGQSVFEFLYVEDAVEGLIAAAENESEYKDAFHIGPGESARMSIIELTKKLSILFDGRVRDVSVNTTDPEKDVYKFLDIDKTGEVLQWTAKWSLEDGLDSTIAWYKENLPKIMPHRYGEERVIPA